MRLIIASNRLPIKIEQVNGKNKITGSAGGLATGLSAYLAAQKSENKNFEYIWAGWPGVLIPEANEQKKLTQDLSKENLYPIFLNKNQIDNFYLGFANDTLWPLFHYFPSYAVYKQEYWQAYRETNEQFCRELVKIIRPGDVVWLHDYHLMLLPKLLKESIPFSVPVGFFLHIPFPSYEIFRLLPQKWRREILKGLLGSDLVGFHTYDYAKYFIGCVRHILGYDTQMHSVHLPEGRKLNAMAFPMGIDFEKFNAAAQKTGIKKRISALKNETKNLKTILSLDRLDYTKGISKRLEAFELFLNRHKEWRGKVRLVLSVSPSRQDLNAFKEMKSEIEELASRINGNFGQIGWTPVVYHYRQLNFEEISAYYSVSDVLMVTPIRDGMNLVSKEYLASRTDSTGCLIISETAGAAQELGEAIVVNPNHTEEIADAIQEALNLPPAQQKANNQIMRARLNRYNLMRWAEEFLENLMDNFVQNQKPSPKISLVGLNAHKIMRDFNRAESKIIFLDYDGTLTPYYKYPYQARPGQELLKLLDKLSQIAGNRVVLISGRDKTTLEEWFPLPNISLIAEHGVWIKNSGRSNWIKPRDISNAWKSTVLPVFKRYVDRLPGSFIEEKEYSIAWHFRLSNPEQSAIISKELTEHLSTMSINTDWQVSGGNKIVETRSLSVTKGTAAMRILALGKYDFILAAGDDTTDEDLFKQLPKKSINIKVGPGPTSAQYSAKNYQEIISLLEKFNKNQ